MIKRFLHAFEVGNVHKNILPYFNVGLTSDEKSLELGNNFLDVADDEGTEEWIKFQGIQGLGFFVDNSLVQDYL